METKKKKTDDPVSKGRKAETSSGLWRPDSPPTFINGL